jgi:hypothetical protein
MSGPPRAGAAAGGGQDAGGAGGRQPAASSTAKRKDGQILQDLPSLAKTTLLAIDAIVAFLPFPIMRALLAIEAFPGGEP